METVPQLVERLQREYPVFLNVSDRDHGIAINSIVVSNSRRCEGFGTAVMQALTAYAKETGRVIGLTPSGDYGSSVRRLREWYKRLGFVENKGRHRRFEFKETFLYIP